MIISWSEFRKALRAANPMLVLVPSITTLSAMVYIRKRGHEDCVPKSDLVEVMAIASPSFFWAGCRLEDFAMSEGDHPSVPPGKKLWVRGYGSFFRKLMKIRLDGCLVMDAQAVKRVLPSAFRRLRANEFKAHVKAFNAEAKTDLQKKKEWLKSRSVPIPGNGMPLGWRADMRDWEKTALELAAHPKERQYRPEVNA